MEIERKFLTKKIPFSLEQYPCSTISQSYISLSPTIRIRQSNTEYFLTVKGKGNMTREEFVLPITKKQYIALEKKCETPPVLKKRYYVPLSENLTAEVDIYEGNLSGLITIEVEFATEKMAKQFLPPKWFGEEVTFDNRYKNTNLSLYGIPKT